MQYNKKRSKKHIDSEKFLNDNKQLYPIIDEIIKLYDAYFLHSASNNKHKIRQLHSKFNSTLNKNKNKTNQTSSNTLSCLPSLRIRHLILKKRYVEDPTWTTKTELNIVNNKINMLENSVSKIHILKKVTLERKIFEDLKRHELQHKILQLKKSYEKYPTLEAEFALKKAQKTLKKLPNMIGLQVVIKSNLKRHIVNAIPVREINRHHAVKYNLKIKIQNLEKKYEYYPNKELAIKLHLAYKCFEHIDSHKTKIHVTGETFDHRLYRARKKLRYAIRELENECKENPNFLSKTELHLVYDCLADAMKGMDVSSRVKSMRSPVNYAREEYLTAAKTNAIKYLKECMEIHSKIPNIQTLSRMRYAQARFDGITQELATLRQNITITMTKDNNRKLKYIHCKRIRQEKIIKKIKNTLVKSFDEKTDLKLKLAKEKLCHLEREAIEFKLQHGTFSYIRRSNK